MKWKDLFYFSHGERRALILLLVLLTGGWIVVNYPFTQQTAKSSEIAASDTIRSSSSKKTTSAQQGKFPSGTIVELNNADTTLLKRIPGIGSAFSNRIIKYRNLLGGFYTVNQLNEVYGIDEERFKNFQKWFVADTLLIQKMNINTLEEDELRKHPYINHRQAKAILKLRKEKGGCEWKNLVLLKEFSEEEFQRLRPYLQVTPIKTND